MRLANIEVMAAMTVLSLAIAGAVYLVGSVVVADAVAAVIAVTMLALATVLWWLVPAQRREHDNAGES